MRGALIFFLLFVCFIFTQAVPTRKTVVKDGSGILIQKGEDPDPEVNAKREFIKQMMMDAYHEYERYAWGENELKPVSQSGHTGDIFGDSKIGSTIVDSLDTLYIMGLMDEYNRGREWVAENLNFKDLDTRVSVFEVNIRFLGGFLSAYAFTQDDLYRDMAHELATLLLPAFETETGVPYRYINMHTGEAENSGPDGPSVLAEFGTLHLEFTYLSEITGDPIFKEKVDKVRQAMKDAEKSNGLYANYFNPHTGVFTDDHVSMGAMGDSYYEYLMKSYIQFGDKNGREMYDEAIDAFIANDLVKTSSPSNLVYFADQRGGEAQENVGHLACFAGGMMALGSYTDPKNPDDGNRDRDMEIGKNFTNTCRESYIRTTTNIGPETFRFNENYEAEPEFAGDKRYVLRPEVVESYFVLYRVTGDSKYRDWAWEAAQAYEKYCKAGPGMGYSGLKDVTADDESNDNKNDVQESFFLAETLKYLYLIFSSNDLVSLDYWTFNTEAHPLPNKASNPLY